MVGRPLTPTVRTGWMVREKRASRSRARYLDPMRSLAALAVATLALSALAQTPEPTPAPPGGAGDRTAEAISRGVEYLLAAQEGENKDQWPYEGVYRVNRQIPVGYRIGGTAIVVTALVQAPGYAQDGPRKDAVARSVQYICTARTDAAMSIDDYAGGYDVRAWGYIEGVLTLCRLRALGATPAGQELSCEEAVRWYLEALQKIEMPGTGGWNYARPAGAETPGAPSPFMTGRALQALFEARACGYEVDGAVVDRGLRVLEKARLPTGSIVYSGEAKAGAENRKSNATPGATGRMNCAESVLVLAGRGSSERVRGAVDAFIVHWSWLDKRRAKDGTHEPPYMIAPYYFMYAHLYAAQAAELLPAAERDEYRRRLADLLFSVRQEDGTWNDRVFTRSASYGTAMAMLALMQPDLRPARWAVGEPAPAP